ncbi:MAG: TatD family hydrolase [Firmicutes bacterium]|nr:TatD family hydrolase [Bacillota bacterium]
MRLFDTHCHLNDETYQADLAAVLARARAAGVVRMLVVGYDLPSSRRALALAEAENGVYAAVGIHPHDAAGVTAADLECLAELLARPQAVALGEIGLDYHYENSPRRRQQEVFRAQLALARKAGKPVVIHGREAHADLVATLKAEGGSFQGVMHCYSGSKEAAREYLEMGLYISVAGPVTFKNARKLPEVVPALPVDRLLIETDAPYLSPHPWRGRRNEPAYLVAVAERVAELLKLPVEAAADLTWNNGAACFGLAAEDNGA